MHIENGQAAAVGQQNRLSNQRQVPRRRLRIPVLREFFFPFSP